MNTLWDITLQNKKVQKDRANLGREMKVKTPSYFQFLMTRLNRLRFADAPPSQKKLESLKNVESPMLEQ